jgi:hypothetical protein
MSLKPSASAVQARRSSGGRVKILFLLSSLRGGGAERVIVTLLQQLDRARFESQLGLVKVRVLI